MEMQDRSVVVTGGASGIGRATALLLAREGARVFIGDIDETGGRAAAAQATGEGLAVEFLPLDLTRTETIAEFADTVHRQVERVDGLVNAAGWDRIQPFMENPHTFRCSGYAQQSSQSRPSSRDGPSDRERGW